MMTVFYVLLAILMFGILILVHEFGHFITAKLSGVQVNEFALFMGPAIWKKQKGETLYSLRCIPIGGYCAMEGEDEDSSNPRAFGNAKVYKRLIILVAGAFMNFLLGFLMVVLFVSIYHGSQIGAIATPAIAEIYEDRPFAQQLQVGDEFYRINGRRVYTADDVGLLLDRQADGLHDIVVLRDGEKVELTAVPMKRDYRHSNGTLLYGLSFRTEEATFGAVLSYSYKESVNFARMVWMSLGDLITGRESVKNVSGLVGVVDIVAGVGTQSSSVGIGLLNVLYLFAFIAINLGVMNLLPIPALDGGRVVCLLITAAAERLLHRKIDPKYEGYLHAGFMILLLGLMLIVTLKDVIGIFN